MATGFEEEELKTKVESVQTRGEAPGAAGQGRRPIRACQKHRVCSEPESDWQEVQCRKI